jgi:hypothetical protein
VGERGRIARRLATALTAVVLISSLTACGAAPSSGQAAERPVLPGVRVGVVANTLDGGLGREQDQVRRLGVRWIREELSWPLIERHRGRVDWRRYDALFADAARRQLRVLPLLNGTPAWLAGDPNSLPPHRAEWARFVAAAVGRYGPAGTFWARRPQLDRRLAPRTFELWNEPYLESNSAGGPDAKRFAVLVRAAVRAGRRTDPAVRYLIPADGAYTRRDGSLGDWLEDMLAADPRLGEVVDAFAVHPYSQGDPRWRRGDPRLQFRRLDDIRADLQRHGLGDRRVWITELGWSTCPLRPQCVTEGDQAAFLRRSFALVQRDYRGFVEAFFVYSLRSGRPRSADAQRWYGLLRYDATRKPAWDVVRRAATGTTG